MTWFIMNVMQWRLNVCDALNRTELSLDFNI